LFTWAKSWRVDKRRTSIRSAPASRCGTSLRARDLQRIDGQVAVDYERAAVSRP
jgi:hypothetical protein